MTLLGKFDFEQLRPPNWTFTICKFCKATPSARFLEDHTLGLAKLPEVVIPDQEDGSKGKDHDAGSGSKHSSLAVAVGALDSQSLRRAHGVGKLVVDDTSNVLGLWEGALGEPLEKLAVEGVGPDGGRDGASKGTANVTSDAQDSEGGGDMLVVNSGEDTNLHAQNEDGSSDGDEDLAHDEVTDGLTRTTEVNHQTLGEDVQRDTDAKEPLEATGLANTPTDDEQEEARDDVESVGNVTGLGGGQVVDDLEERVEITGPAVVADHVDEIQPTDTDDGSVSEELVLEERLGGDEALVETEDDEDDEASDDHGNDIRGVPTLWSHAGNGEGEQEDDSTSGEQQGTGSY